MKKSTEENWYRAAALVGALIGLAVGLTIISRL